MLRSNIGSGLVFGGQVIPCSSGGKSVPVGEIDAQVDNLIGAMKLPSAWKLRVLNSVQQLGTPPNLATERRRLQERLRRLGSVYADGLMDEPEYRRKKTDTEAQLEALEPAEQREALGAGQYLERLASLWAEMTTEERWRVLNTMLTAVYVHLPTRRVVGLKARTPFIPILRLCSDSVRIIDEEGELFDGDPEGIRTLDLHRDRVAC
jgi:hypothetical protein